MLFDKFNILNLSISYIVNISENKNINILKNYKFKKL